MRPATLTGAAILALVLSAGMGSAAPAPPGAVLAPDTGVSQARTVKSRRAARRSLRRGRRRRLLPPSTTSIMAPALPSSSPAIGRARDINSSLIQQERNRGVSQQNQFEVNQLRQDIGRGSVSASPSVGVGTPGRICPPGATAC